MSLVAPLPNSLLGGRPGVPLDVPESVLQDVHGCSFQLANACLLSTVRLLPLHKVSSDAGDERTEHCADETEYGWQPNVHDRQSGVL